MCEIDLTGDDANREEHPVSQSVSQAVRQAVRHPSTDHQFTYTVHPHHAHTRAYTARRRQCPGTDLRIVGTELSTQNATPAGGLGPGEARGHSRSSVMVDGKT